MIQVISSVLVHYLDSQTPPVQAELIGQEDRVRQDTYRGGRERDTVEPLNKGHFGSRGFVLFSEVVLWWEVQANRLFIDLVYLDNMF